MEGSMMPMIDHVQDHEWTISKSSWTFMHHVRSCIYERKEKGVCGDQVVYQICVMKIESRSTILLNDDEFNLIMMMVWRQNHQVNKNIMK